MSTCASTGSNIFRGRKDVIWIWWQNNLQSSIKNCVFWKKTTLNSTYLNIPSYALSSLILQQLPGQILARTGFLAPRDKRVVQHYQGTSFVLLEWALLPVGKRLFVGDSPLTKVDFSKKRKTKRASQINCRNLSPYGKRQTSDPSWKFLQTGND